MYESFFRLQRRPFAMTPDPHCFHAAPGLQAILDELVITAEQGLGTSVVIGPAGIGKTLLCERLAQELTPRLMCVLLRHGNFATRRGLLQAILCELGQPYSKLSDQELRLELLPLLREIRQRHQGLVLICDEAHTLSDEQLEELRLLTDLSEQGSPLVRLVLAGQLDLEDKLAHPRLSALGQRIVSHLSVLPMMRDETLGYIDHRLTWAGGAARKTFSREALELVYRISDGVPRAVNQLCDHALLLAYVSDCSWVDASHIEQSLEDLRRLPLQWHEPSSRFTGATDSLDEFADGGGESALRNEPRSVGQSETEKPITPSAIGPTAEAAVFEFGSRLEALFPSARTDLSSTGDRSSITSVPAVPDAPGAQDAPRTPVSAVTPDDSLAVMEPLWERVDQVCLPRLGTDSFGGPDNATYSAGAFADSQASRSLWSLSAPNEEPGPRFEARSAQHAETGEECRGEELVHDRYARIDAGLPVEDAAQDNAGLQAASSGDVWEVLQPTAAPLPAERAVARRILGADRQVEDELQSTVLELMHSTRRSVEPQNDAAIRDASHFSRTDAPEADDDFRLDLNDSPTSDAASASGAAGHVYSVEFGADLPTRDEDRRTDGPHSKPRPTEETASEPVAPAPTHRPYRHLFSQLRRKMSGLQ